MTEQVAHYRARASDYLEGARAVPGVSELEAALLAFQASGDLLELACGPATWTPTLLRSASTVTAVDAARVVLLRRQEHHADLLHLGAEHLADRPQRLVAHGLAPLLPPAQCGRQVAGV